MLNELESWAKDSNQSPVFWLNGLAGTGKSTIAQTVSERIFADGQLGASFFCSRDFEDRSDLHFIFPTLAFQLAHKFPEFRSILVPLLQSNPDVAHESLYRQMEKLIVEPLRSADVSTVIVIDALDECKDEEPSSAILSVLARLVGQIPKVKFFITGRPEPRIRTGFRLPILVNSTSVFVLHDVDPPLINSDIRLFLKHELSELAQRRQLGRWPSDEHIDLLCSRAAGLFVYAVATVKFLDSNIHLPKHRLDVIVKLPECTAPEGKTRFNPKTTLDSLYASILQTAFIEGDPGVYSRVRSTLGAVVLLVNPLPPPGIAELVGLEPEEVILFLTLVQSLLALGEGFHQPVKPFHKSFPDFITDPARCTDMRFHISPKDLHLELAMNCLEIINGELEHNLLSLPDYALNSGVEDLQTRIDDRISIALRYACRSWHNHLTETEGDVTNVVSYLHTFLEEKFLAWLEVASVVGAVGAAVVALERLMPWLQEVCFWPLIYHHPMITYNDQVAKDEQLLDIARDCFQFVTNFFEVINVSAPHIYHSALELCPASSTIRKLYYHRRINHSPKVVIGTPESWAPTIGVSGKDRYNGPCIWSPCGRFVAVQTRKAVEIRNQLTLELITILQPTETTHHLTGLISYSPDGRSIACTSEATIIIWDVQTGGVAKEIGCGAKNISLVWSLDGRMLCTINSEHRMTFIVHTYDVSSGTTSPSGTLESDSNPHLWGHDKSFRVMTTMRYGRDAIIDIFEVETALTKIRSYLCPLPNQSSSTPPPNHPKANIWSFSPTTYRVSVSDGHTLYISDLRMRLCLLDKKGCFPSHCFSSDGSLFAASQKGDVHIWKYSLHRYHPWREFRCQGWPNSPLQFSPTPSSIMGHSGDILQVWRLNELPTTPKSRPQPCVGISRSGSRITAAHKLESTVTIIGPLAQTPPQFIDTNMMIEGFVLTGNVLLVADSETLVAWLLTEEGLVDGVIGDRRVGRSDSIWTVSLPRFSFDPCLFWVRGQVGVIKLCGNALHVYHTETGEVLHPAQAPQGFNDRSYLFTDTFRGRSDLCYHDLSQRDSSPEDSWQISQAALRKGWVKNPEGKHRLWVPVEWRTDWDSGDWLHDVTAQFSIFEGRPVLIKFYPSPTEDRETELIIDQ